MKEKEEEDQEEEDQEEEKIFQERTSDGLNQPCKNPAKSQAPP